MLGRAVSREDRWRNVVALILAGDVERQPGPWGTTDLEDAQALFGPTARPPKFYIECVVVLQGGGGGAWWRPCWCSAGALSFGICTEDC